MQPALDPDDTTGGPDLRPQRRAVAADDAQVRQIVALVDALGDRGQAEALIAPLRPRLAKLRPPRPLSLTRLLFLPIDPLIVPARRWQPGALGVPRTALPALLEAATATLGNLPHEVGRLLAGHTTSETDVAIETGDRLWPAAAAALAAHRPPPPRWTETSGLRAEDYPAMARAVAALLAHGSALYRLAVRPSDAMAPAAAEALLTAAADAGGDVLAMMLVLLLASSPDPGALLPVAEAVASRSAPGDRAAPQRSIDFLLGAFDDDDTADGPGLPDHAAV